MNTSKNPFCMETYKNVFQNILEFSEITNKDECLADMDEPKGNKISYVPRVGQTAKCKAFITTTTSDRLLVAIFDIYGKFYTYYEMQLSDMKNYVMKKAFGGVNISFNGKTNAGFVAMKMYIPKYDFGSDLKEQKVHLRRLVENLCC